MAILESGIYRIVVLRPEGPRFYIGQALNLSARKLHHAARLRIGSHKNKKLQSAFDKHGEAAFSFDTILICSADAAILRMYEQSILDFYVATFGDSSIYNVHRNCVSSRIGIPISEETRAKMRAAAAGRKPSIACIEAGRKYNIGKKRSPESIALRTSKQKGLKRSPETRARMSAVRIGFIPSKESVQRMAATKKAQGMTPAMWDQVARLAALNSGKHRSDATKQAIREKKLGTKKPPEETARRLATRRANAITRGYY